MNIQVYGNSMSLEMAKPLPQFYDGFIIINDNIIKNQHNMDAKNWKSREDI